MRTTMSEPAGAAAIGIGIKSGLFAGLFVFAVSAMAVGVGFTVVPLDAANPIRDAARRLAAGLFCAFTLGMLVTIKALTWFPELLPFWRGAFEGFPVEARAILAYTAAATPFFAICALLGFWIVGGLMRYFTNRKDKDLGQIGADVAADVRSAFGPRP